MVNNKAEMKVNIAAKNTKNILVTLNSDKNIKVSNTPNGPFKFLYCVDLDIPILLIEIKNKLDAINHEMPLKTTNIKTG